jgi:SAM-dependent methyltransferase
LEVSAQVIPAEKSMNLPPRAYLTDLKCLAWFREAATADFWDRHWETEGVQGHLLRASGEGFFVRMVKRHLPRGSALVEGGCGRGQLIRALRLAGHRAIGIDFAQRTVKAVHEAMPELSAIMADVRHLPLEEASLDGYLSVGVIEHLWEGYGPILAEMARTVRPGGFSFVSFPYMSPLRRLKVRLGAYSTGTKEQYRACRDSFYQFALPVAKVQGDLERMGFRLVERLAYDGIKGLKDEVSLARQCLRWLYNARRGHRLRSCIDRLLRTFASHCVVLVMRKSPEGS